MSFIQNMYNYKFFWDIEKLLKKCIHLKCDIDIIRYYKLIKYCTTVFLLIPLVVVDIYRCKLGLFGDLSTASGCSDPRGMVVQSYTLALETFIFLSLYIFLFSLFSAYLHPLFISLTLILLFPCTIIWENTHAWLEDFLLTY